MQSTRPSAPVPSPAPATAPLATPPLPDLSESLTCPITHDVVRDPVVAADGYLYERTAIEDWLRRSALSPMTGAPLVSRVLYSIYPLRSGLGTSTVAPVRKATPPPLSQQTAHAAHILDAFAVLNSDDRAAADAACTTQGLAAQQALTRLIAAHGTGDALLGIDTSLPAMLGPVLAALAQRAADAAVRRAAVNYMGCVVGLQAVRDTLAVLETQDTSTARAQMFAVVARLQAIAAGTQQDAEAQDIEALLEALAHKRALPEELRKACVWALFERCQRASERQGVYARLRRIATEDTTGIANVAAMALFQEASLHDVEYGADAAVYLAANAQQVMVRNTARSWKAPAA